MAELVMYPLTLEKKGLTYKGEHNSRLATLLSGRSVHYPEMLTDTETATLKFADVPHLRTLCVETATTNNWLHQELLQ